MTDAYVKFSSFRMFYQMWILFVVLLCDISAIESQTDVKYPTDADVYIGGFFSSYVPKSDGCSNDVCFTCIEEFEAARWTINKLNENKFLPNGLKIGIQVINTCGIPEEATSATINLLQSYNKPNSTLLFGLLSPVRSSEAKVVSRLLSSLPEKDRIIMLSYGATSSRLHNKEIYKNFFRIIPTDSLQVQVMLQLMLQLDWNYVGIIYEDGDYGTDAANELRLLAQNNSICVPIFLSFNTSFTTEAVYKFLDEIKTNSIRGIVYIGTGPLLAEVQNLSEDIEIIVSESIKLRKSYFIRNGRGSLVASVPKINMQEFADHWENILNSNQSDGLIDVAKQNIPDSNDQSVYIYYVIKAVSVLANLFKNIHEQECQNMTIICSKLYNLSKQKYIDGMQTLKTDLVETFPYIFQDDRNNSSETVTFDSNRENSNPNGTQYEVFNYQTCQSPEEFCFKKVGELRDTNLCLNTSLIRMYDRYNNNQPYDILPVAQCPDYRNCLKCLRSDLPGDVIYVEGDWYIVGVVPIFRGSTDSVLLCGNEIRESIGTDIAESIKFAIEYINNPNGLFVDVLNGSKIGLIVLNDCETKLVIKDKIIRLHKGTYEIRPGFMSSQIKNRILGYIGGLGSSTSAAIADVLTELGYVQVSYASTSPRLSDRTKYPYFMRIPTTDDQQARVIIDVVASLGANYIQVIYSKGAYGEGGLVALQAIASSRKVCIAQGIEISSALGTYNNILPNLRKQPHARLVVTFIRSHVINHVIAHIIQGMVGSDGFVFIGSETWGRRAEILGLEQNQNLLGSISISLELPPIPEFTQYLANQNINDPSNPWLRTFWETRGKCIFPGSFLRKGKSETCKLNHLTAHGTFQQDPWIPFAVAATYSLITGVRSVLSSSNCRASDENCLEREPFLLANLMKKNVKLPDSEGLLKRTFNDNGDGVVDYTILQIHHNQGGSLQYKTIGKWSSYHGIGVRSSEITFPHNELVSVCETDFDCQKCFGKDTANYTSESVNSQRASDQWIIYTLSGVISIMAIVCVIVVVKLCLIRHFKRKDPHYVDPGSIQMSRLLQGKESQTSDIYLTAKSSFGVANTMYDESPQPCRLTPSQESNQSHSLQTEKKEPNLDRSATFNVNRNGGLFENERCVVCV